MKRMVCGLVLLLCAFDFFCGLQANALPMFARREGVACQMCHYRFPELNADGMAYMRRGLREQGPKELAAKSTAEKPALGEPVPLPQFANYFSAVGHPALAGAQHSRFTFDASSLDLWVGGPIDQHFTGFANPIFDIEGGGTSVEQGYAQYTTGSTSSFQSVRAGQFIPFATLFNQGGPSMSLSAPLILSTPPDTGTDWTPTNPVRAVEVGVNRPRWNVYLGAGQPVVTGAGAGMQNIDFYASADYLFGKSSNSLTGYGYWGSAELAPDSGNDFHRVGVITNVYVGSKTKAIAGYLTGEDKTLDNRTLKDSGYFFMAEYLFSEPWAAYARYDHFKQDLDAGGAQTISGPAVGVTWWVQSQIRLTTEAQFISTTDQPNTNSLTTEFLWAF